MLAVSVLAGSMLISDTSYTEAIVSEAKADEVASMETSALSPKIVNPVAIDKIDVETKPIDYSMGAKIVLPEPEPVVVEQPVVENKNSSNSRNDNNNSSKSSNSSSSKKSSDSNRSSEKKNNSVPKKENKPKSDILLHDNIAGRLADPNHVPCGGLWEYYYDNFYAREINCGGSDIYLNISKGQKVTIAGKVCEMVGSQTLNYHSNTMSDVKWYGNTIVQTCYHGNRGKVRLANFNCG